MANAESLTKTNVSEESNEPEDKWDPIRAANGGPPADGATKSTEALPRESPTTVQHAEPEDAYLTGGQRNLQRRVLGLNVEAGLAQPIQGQSAGIHSTGSFTGTANGDEGPDKNPAKER